MKNEDKLRLVVGALLHDIGKVVYRAGLSAENHSKSGADYLSGANFTDKDVLDCVKYHHAKELKDASLPADSDAYIVYMADNIASATDRREQIAGTTGGFEKDLPLSSIFNLLNGNDGKAAYNPRHTNAEEKINFPGEDAPPFDEGAYKKILADITDNLKGIELSTDYVNSLLNVLEAQLSFVPSSTNKQEAADISLYNHVKLTAAFAAAMKDSLTEMNQGDYRQYLFKDGKNFYDKKVFLLTVLDLSGIQKFIYTINSDGALKALRSRSFYLDFMTGHIADILLEELGLTRANLVYVGGGRADLILADTKNTRHILAQFIKRTNAWFEKYFDIALYMAVGYASASCNDLKNEPEGSYAALYQQRAKSIAACKGHRYDAAEIIGLNNREFADDTRECAVCKRVDALNEENLCGICAALKSISSFIMNEKYVFAAAVPSDNSDILPLPGGYGLTMAAENDGKLLSQTEGVRLYRKNRFFTGKNLGSPLWIGDYHTGEDFGELAEQATGVKRLGVLRADVDNLGATFAFGFRRPGGDQRFVTVSRTAELSRQLTMFFKLHIKKILNNPEFTMLGKKKDKRHAAIVYSGGDDLFIVGAWDDVIELAADIRRNFARYTQNALTISAGIGIYQSSYPISVMAQETANLEEKSKIFPGKNAVTLPSDGGEYELADETGRNIKLDEGTYSWETLENHVIGEKLRCLDEFFDLTNTDERQNQRGKNFLYNLLALLRGRDEKINLARYVYLLSRMEPDKDASAEEKERYREFADKMYKWNLNDEDTRQLKTAILLYVYLTRKREEKDDAER